MKYVQLPKWTDKKAFFNFLSLFGGLWHLFCRGMVIKNLKIMAFIDYYKIMGIPKDTPQKDIRAAYKKRARLFHPDLHPDDPKAKAKFQMLNEAN